MDVKIAPDWKELLSPEFEKPYFAALTQFVRQEYATHRIYPRGSNIFRAFDKCPFDKLKVVIIGQDPYHGWGDMLVLLFFGFVPVGCTYYVLCGGWTWQVAVVAAACGLVIDTLLMVNNYRDREQDARSGKRTLVVRLGERAGQRLYLLSGFAAAALCLGLWGDGRTWAALLPLLYLPPHVAAWRRMIRIGRGRELNAVLGATSRNILLFGLLLTLGLLL